MTILEGVGTTRSKKESFRQPLHPTDGVFQYAGLVVAPVAAITRLAVSLWPAHRNPGLSSRPSQTTIPMRAEPSRHP